VQTLERSAMLEGRSLAFADQDSRPAEGRGRWCAGGMALLAGGIAAAAVAFTRRDPNPQKPSPPPGFVLGVGAAAVGGVQTLRSCGR
jgi:hypothetical protein